MWVVHYLLRENRLYLVVGYAYYSHLYVFPLFSFLLTFYNFWVWPDDLWRPPSSDEIALPHRMYVITSGENSQLIQADDIRLSMEIFHFYWKRRKLLAKHERVKFMGWRTIYGAGIRWMIIVFKKMLCFWCFIFIII